MLPFLRFHSLAAVRGDGLRPELRILLERLAEAPATASHVALADRDFADDIHFQSGTAFGQETFEGGALGFDQPTVQSSRTPR
jgi:hypothetical protein